MKIFYLSAATIPSEKSHSLSIMRVCQALADSGHDVTLSAIANPENDSDPVTFYGLHGGFKIVRHNFNRIWNNRISKFILLAGFALAWKSRNLIKKTVPDIIYSRLTISELFFVPPKLPIVYEMHSLGPLGRGGLQRMVFKWIVRHKNFRRIIVTTKTLADLLQKYFPAIDIVVARLSAELPLEVIESDLALFKERQLQGNRFKFHVGYTGYMDTYGLRGTEIIIQTAARMPKAAFHIVGGEQNVIKYWCEYAVDYNQHNNIFFYGYRNPNEMPLFLNCFDVVLAPLQYCPLGHASISAGMSPLKLPQYMSYGKAIVASDIPAHREYLKHRQTAILVSQNCIEDWVDAIEYLINNPEINVAIGHAARSDYYDEHTPQIRVLKLLEGF